MSFISRNQLEIILSDIANTPYFAYGKTRIAGSTQNSYYMHSKSGCMPGQTKVFVQDSTTKPFEINELNMNQIMDIFKRDKYKLSKKAIGIKYLNQYQESFTFEKFHSYTDEALHNAIAAAYKQIFGNFYPMESERSKDSERRLRNGDIPIREFIRSINKSMFYRTHFVEKVSQKRCVELNVMHLLGRPILDLKELESNIKFINSRGFSAHVDNLVDSLEYEEFFGEDLVPFQRNWNSPCGSTTLSFLKTASFRKGYASSDNVNPI